MPLAAEAYHVLQEIHEGYCENHPGGGEWYIKLYAKGVISRYGQRCSRVIAQVQSMLVFFLCIPSAGGRP